MTFKAQHIAVVGLSGIFPGAKDVETFGRNIMAGTSAVIDVPVHRWTLPPQKVHSTAYRPDTAASTRAGLITDFTFDPHGFSLDPELLLQLDPLHHLVLSAGRIAAAQCYCPAKLRETTGVILAAIALPTQCTSDLARKILMGPSAHAPTPAEALACGVVSVPAALLARAMGFQGGAWTLDAACASSLFAIKLACDQLNSGRADMMIAGGVSRPDSLYTQIGFTQLKALSPSGRCAPFDRNADGLVVGEGTGMVVLKRLTDALACGDTIHGIITGAGWSNDIGGNLVAPASDGQVRAMAAAYGPAGWDPCDVQLMECHGSATPVGDAVEVNSMQTLWETAGCTARENSCAIGSVKSMVGHLLTAAGAAGFIKTLLALKEKTLPPSLNFSAPPDNSPLDASCFHVQTRPEPWYPRPLRRNPAAPPNRRAGISAFGFGGINAHILVEAFQQKSHGISVPETLKPIPKARDGKPMDPVPSSQPKDVAIVGMALFTTHVDALSQITSAMVSPDVDGKRQTAHRLSPWMETIETLAGEFHIPPNQLPDILPQHLVMLKAAMKALEDAGIPLRRGPDEPERTRFGAALGIEFDHGATDFHLNWSHARQHGGHPPLPLKFQGEPLPPLTANRTLGALGGIVASRIAREFQLGGPCFTLSAQACSGLTAVEVGMASLQAGETDLFLCGAVDMAGDLRQHAIARSLAGALCESHKDSGSSPLEKFYEGAAAVVLKPLEKALNDGDRIYSIISATGSASAGETAAETAGYPPASTPHLDHAYKKSLQRALDQWDIPDRELDLYMLQACGSPLSPGREQAMAAHLTAHRAPLDRAVSFVGNTLPLPGHAGAVSGLISIVQASLALYHGLMPSTPPSGTTPVSGPHGNGGPHPHKSADTRPLPWQAHAAGDHRWACVAAITTDGACGHVILGKAPGPPVPPALAPSVPTVQKKTAPPIRLKAHRFPAPVPSHPLPVSPPDPDLPAGSVLPADDRHLRAYANGEAHPVGHRERSDVPYDVTATARAHMKFLDFTRENTKACQEQFQTLTRLAEDLVMTHGRDTVERDRTTDGGEHVAAPPAAKADIPMPSPDNVLPRGIGSAHRQPSPSARAVPLFDRQQCLTFAVGRAGDVLGEKFKILDTCPVRVRLPDEPLMLVDRILSIEGESCSMGPGKIVTQHDVHENAWYLDGDRAPVSISIEAGQADLFLCSWLGIDHQVMGKRRYRLLDAKVTFHRPLPRPGETIEYHIEIDRFLRQGEVYLFFFHYKGYIDNTLFISMRDGCAGFFTPEEVKNSGGIILKKEDLAPQPRSLECPLPVPGAAEAFSDEKVAALRRGDMGRAFGRAFQGIVLGTGLRLPGRRMHLIDRVLSFEPKGGRFGLGRIVAEADIDPYAWFLTCHFVDDPVMPGTLMYECCAHALRIFTQRMGWITPRNDVFYDILPGLESDLKCRGPVTPETRKARYEIEIKKMGYDPEPCVVADAHMFSDDHRIVYYKNMGMKLVGLDRREIEGFWSNR